MEKTKKVAVVIPCYRVIPHILNLINSIGPIVSYIYVVDDCCPDRTGEFVSENITDPRVEIIYNPINLGVGGSVMAGYCAALKSDASIIVKVDGDGQMDPALIPLFVDPIILGLADYTKGNRFFDLDKISSMPINRIIGNSMLAFVNKISSGYYNIFDPNNGFTAISSYTAKRLPLYKISNRYFFESDILFRLNTLRAVVIDIPMEAKYGDEVSNLFINIFEILLKEFFIIIICEIFRLLP